jgi:hypothetical protein
MDDYTYDYGTYDSTYQMSDGDAALLGTAICGFYIVMLVLVLVMMAGMWKMFIKANKPGWAAIVPIYNIIVLLEIVGRPAWWVVLYIIPVANLVATIMVSIDVAKAYGKGTGTAIGLIFLPYIFYPMLGFGKAQYQGSANTVSVADVPVTPPPAPAAV